MAKEERRPAIPFVKAVSSFVQNNPFAAIKDPLVFAKGTFAAAQTYFSKDSSKFGKVPDTSGRYSPQYIIPPGTFDWETDKSYFAKEGRSTMPYFSLAGDAIRNDLWQPFFEPRFLLMAYIQNWMLQSAINKVIEEVTKEYDLENCWEPKFAFRCDKCDMNYKDAPKGKEQPAPDRTVTPLEGNKGPFCDSCGGKVRRPDPGQLRGIKKLMEHPTWDRLNMVGKSFKDILREATMYNQVMEDIWWEVIPASDGTPAELNSLPAEYMRIVVDGRERFFCPQCFMRKAYLTPKPYGEYMYTPAWQVMQGAPAPRIGQTLVPVPTKCPECNTDMKLAKYVQINDGFNVMAAWADDEIIHYNSRAYGSRRYGIPKTISVYTLARILYFQEHYQEAKYSQNRLPEKAIAFPELSQKAIQETIETLAEWWQVNPHAPRYMFLAAQKPPVVVDFGIKFEDLAAKDMALYYREAIAMVFGVSLTMLGVQTPSKLGRETEQIEVSFDTIEEVQEVIQDMVNNRLLPRFRALVLEGIYKPVITDWKFVLKSPKRDDLQRKAFLQESNVRIFEALANLGGKATLSEDLLNVKLEEPMNAEDVQAAAMQMGGQEGEEGGGGDAGLQDRLNRMKPGESLEVQEKAGEPWKPGAYVNAKLQDISLEPKPQLRPLTELDRDAPAMAMISPGVSTKPSMKPADLPRAEEPVAEGESKPAPQKEKIHAVKAGRFEESGIAGDIRYAKPVDEEGFDRRKAKKRKD